MVTIDLGPEPYLNLRPANSFAGEKCTCRINGLHLWPHIPNNRHDLTAATSQADACAAGIGVANANTPDFASWVHTERRICDRAC